MKRTPVQSNELTISVVVCTYQRSENLRKCLVSLAEQSLRPLEVLVIVRLNDLSSQRVVKDAGPPCRSLTVGEPGVIAATNLALQHVNGDIVAFTDDDAEPHSDWLQRIKEVFNQDSAIGAVGGRDRLFIPGEPELADPPVRERVGVLTLTGACIGEHHCPIRSQQLDVNFLKGVNLAVRKSAVREMSIDTRLFGTGAQPGWEMDLCFQIRERGFRVVYSRDICVDHHPAARLDGDRRHDPSDPGGQASLFNTAYVVCKYASTFTSVCFLIRGILRGNRMWPGFLLACLLSVRGDKTAFSRFRTGISLLRKAVLQALLVRRESQLRRPDTVETMLKT